MSAAPDEKYPENVENQWFVEPTFCTKLLLDVESFSGVTLDPACGQGNIVRTMIEAGVAGAFGSDLVQRTNEPWFLGCDDFLKPRLDGFASRSPHNIVCNPPFFRAKGTEAFIRRALQLASRKVAVFVETKFLAGQGRASGLFAELPPDRVWIITPRPSCPPGQFLLDGGSAEGGKSDACWLVWDLTLPIALRGDTRLLWLRGEGKRQSKLRAQSEQQEAA